MVAIQRFWAALKTSDADVGPTSACNDDDDDQTGKELDVVDVSTESANSVGGVTPNADTDANEANRVKGVAMGTMMERGSLRRRLNSLHFTSGVSIDMKSIGTS